MSRGVICLGAGAGAAFGWASLGPAMVGSVFGAVVGFLLGRFALQNVIQRLAVRRPKLGTLARLIRCVPTA